MSYPHPILAREGWPFIGGSIVAAALVNVFAGFWWALPVWVIALFVVQFFRDPPRVIPEVPDAVLSPADVRVDVYLPLTATPKAAVGDKVYATSTVLATLG